MMTEAERLEALRRICGTCAAMQREVNAIDSQVREIREWPTQAERAEWSVAKLEARVWWCEDEVCNCHQPQIDRITPNTRVGYPWTHREEVWRGTFHSDGEGLAEMVEELREECARRGIPLEEPTVVGSSPYAWVNE